jgi:hypothetical protein
MVCLSFSKSLFSFSSVVCGVVVVCDVSVVVGCDCAVGVVVTGCGAGKLGTAEWKENTPLNAEANATPCVVATTATANAPRTTTAPATMPAIAAVERAAPEDDTTVVVTLVVLTIGGVITMPGEVGNVMGCVVVVLVVVADVVFAAQDIIVGSVETEH